MIEPTASRSGRKRNLAAPREANGNNVSDQYSQEPEGDSQDGADIAGRVNKLMASLGRRTNERDEALRRAEAAEADLAAAKTALESRPEPRIDMNRPLRQPAPQPSPVEALHSVSWSDLGVRDR
jgi:hypothetical protein